MTLFARMLTFAVGLLVATKVQAESPIDPSSALLLSTESPSAATARPVKETGLESGRYTVRPKTAKDPKEPRESTTASPQAKRPHDPIQESAPPSAVVLKPNAQGSVVVDTASPERAPPSLAVTEASGPTMLEINVSPVFHYESSESSYSYRQYIMSGPAYHVSGRVWLSPEFGVGASQFSTLAGQVQDQTGSIAATRSEFAAGVFVKKDTGQAQMVFGLEAVDSQFKVASDVTSKLRTKTTGVRFSIEGLFTDSERSAWGLGFSILPKAQHSEASDSTSTRSGADVETYVIGASLQRVWRIAGSSGSNSINVRLQSSLERNVFSGAATAVDPIGGATPSSVGVTVGTTLIQFGYSWGN